MNQANNSNARLFIEGYELDLDHSDTSSDMPLTFTIDDVSDLTTQKSSHSKTITVPGTHKNNMLLDFFFEPKSTGGFAGGQQQYTIPSSIEADVVTVDATGPFSVYTGLPYVFISGLTTPWTVPSGSTYFETGGSRFGIIGSLWFPNVSGSTGVQRLYLTTTPGHGNYNQEYQFINQQFLPPPNIGFNYNPKKLARCYVMEGSSVALRGYARLIGSTETNGRVRYQIQVQSDLGSFISNLGQYRLEDLSNITSVTYTNTQVYQTIADPATIGQSWISGPITHATNADDNVPLWPIIDYGGDAPQNGIDLAESVNGSNFYISNLRPCLFAKQYWDLIFQYAGYRYESNFLTSPYFKSLVIPYCDGAMTQNPATLLVDTYLTDPSLTQSVNQPFDNAITQTGNTSIGYYLFDAPPTGATVPYTGTTFYAPTTNLFQFNVNFTYQWQFQPDPSWTGQYFTINQQVWVCFDIYDSSGSYLSTQPFLAVDGTHSFDTNDSIRYQYGPMGPGNDVTSNYNFPNFHYYAGTNYNYINQTFNVALQAGQQCRTRILPLAPKSPVSIFLRNTTFFSANADHINGNVLFQIFRSAGSGSPGAPTTIDPFMVIGYSSIIDQNQIDFYQMVPKNIKMIDYIQSILTLFNLYVLVDTEDPYLLKIYTRDEFYDNADTVDWTRKIDRLQDQVNTPIPKLQDQNLLFTYKSATDYWNKLYTQYWGGEYGYRLVNTGYQFAQNTKNVTDKIIFSPTPIVQYNNNPVVSETTCEVYLFQDAAGDFISVFQVSGYHNIPIDSQQIPSLQSFDRARSFGQIVYWGNTYTIISVINPWQFIVNGTVTRPAGAVGGNTYLGTSAYAISDTFSYITDQNKQLATMYESSDNNHTRKYAKTNPRILSYNGIQFLDNGYIVQATPYTSGNTLGYFQENGGFINVPGPSASSPHWSTGSTFGADLTALVTQYINFPVLHHLNNLPNITYNSGTNISAQPTFDLNFAPPLGVFFDASQINYPQADLYTTFWQNTVNEMTDPESFLLEAQFDLDPIDISNLDLRNLVQVNGVNYRISSITDYNPDRATTTQVDLVKVPFQDYVPNPVLAQPVLVEFINQGFNASFGDPSIAGQELEPVRSYYTDLVYPGGESVFGYLPTQSQTPTMVTLNFSATTVTPQTVVLNDDVQTQVLTVTSGSTSYSFSGVTMAFRKTVTLTMYGSSVPLPNPTLYFYPINVGSGVTLTTPIISGGTGYYFNNGSTMGLDPGAYYYVNLGQQADASLVFSIFNAYNTNLQYNLLYSHDSGVTYTNLQSGITVIPNQTVYFGPFSAPKATSSPFVDVLKLEMAEFAAPTLVEAIVDSTALSTITNITVQGTGVTYVSGATFPVHSGQTGFFQDYTHGFDVNVYVNGVSGDTFFFHDTAGNTTFYNITGGTEVLHIPLATMDPNGVAIAEVERTTTTTTVTPTRFLTIFEVDGPTPVSISYYMSGTTTHKVYADLTSGHTFSSGQTIIDGGTQLDTIMNYGFQNLGPNAMIADQLYSTDSGVTYTNFFGPFGYNSGDTFSAVGNANFIQPNASPFCDVFKITLINAADTTTTTTTIVPTTTTTTTIAPTTTTTTTHSPLGTTPFFVTGGPQTIQTAYVDNPFTGTLTDVSGSFPIAGRTDFCTSTITSGVHSVGIFIQGYPGGLAGSQLRCTDCFGNVSIQTVTGNGSYVFTGMTLSDTHANFIIDQPVNVTISPCGSQSGTSVGGNVNSNQTTATSLTIGLRVTDSTGAHFFPTTSISAGNTSGPGWGTTITLGSTLTNIEVISISPANSGTQTYVPGAWTGHC